jgi:hypothetical protein
MLIPQGYSAFLGYHFFFMPPFFLGAGFCGLAGPVYLGMVCANPQHVPAV